MTENDSPLRKPQPEKPRNMDCPECDGLSLDEIKICGTCGAAAPTRPRGESFASSTGSEDSAPYWLAYAMAELIVANMECGRLDICRNTSMCVTEYCAVCAAEWWLELQTEEQNPQNVRISDGEPQT